MDSLQTRAADAQSTPEELAALLGIAARRLTGIPQDRGLDIGRWAYAAKELLSQEPIVPDSFQRVEGSSLQPSLGLPSVEGTAISDPGQLIVLPLETGSTVSWYIEKAILCKAVANMAQNGIEAFRVTWRTPPAAHVREGFGVDTTHFGLAVDSCSPGLESKLVQYAMAAVESSARSCIETVIDRDLPQKYRKQANTALLQMLQERLAKAEI